MKKFLNVLGVALVLSVIVLASCQKKQEDRIAETWRLIRVSVDSTVTWYEQWQFDGQNVQMVTRDTSTTSLDTIATGTYTVDAGLSKTIINMKDFSATQYNGDWEVLKLNKDIMVILNTTDGEWLYREFVKE